eukprot:ANDGO_08019.mRNA.1 Pyruvate kinase
MDFDFFSNDESRATRTSPWRRTRIICTIGPKTQSVDMLKQLLDSGMNICRLNFSHGSHEYHQQTVDNIKIARQEANKICSILLDTKGPEIRTGNVDPSIEGGEFVLKKGQKLTVEAGKEAVKKPCTPERIAIDYENAVKRLKAGGSILINDGMLGLKVLEVFPDENRCVCEVMNTSVFSSKKGVNLPGVEVDLPAMSEQDKLDIAFASKNWLDYVAASFIRCADDVHAIRKLLSSDKERHGHNVKIIAKIENQQGLDNFDEILAAADGIMVARGDLGVEIPFEKVCLAQKMMIAKCNAAGKLVVTATQMLETMIYSPYPTRAEATDVANAVFDGTDCVMLSAETAKGAYPLEAVDRMARICAGAEAVFDNQGVFHSLHDRASKLQLSLDEAIALSAVKTANDLGASLIVTYTNSGRTARLVAKYRPSALVFCMTPFDRTARQILAYRGLFPVVIRPTTIPPDGTPTSEMSEEFDPSQAFAQVQSPAREQGADAFTRHPIHSADYMKGMDMHDFEEGVDFDFVLIQCLNMARARGIVRVGDFVIVVRSLAATAESSNNNTNVLRVLTVPEPQVSFDSVL